MRAQQQQPMMPPAVLVVTGASGAGKTTLVRRLAALGLPGVGCYEFDTIGIPSEEEIRARFGDGAGFQRWALGEWVARLARNADGVRVAVLDAQVRPRAARGALARHGVQVGGVVLVDCDYAERNARLRGPRGQPELATAQMDGWAAYLRGQADALDVAVVDTTGASPDASLTALRAHVDALIATTEPPGTVETHMTKPDISGIAPFFIVKNVPAALSFYRDRLGFDIAFQGPDPDDIFFGIVQRGAAMIMLKDVGVDPLPNYKRDVKKGWARWDAYLHVPDPDALATEFSSRNVEFSQPLKDDDDGLRGFELKDTDGYVLFFGRPRS